MSTENPTLDERIAAAEKAGDWYTHGRLSIAAAERDGDRRTAMALKSQLLGELNADSDRAAAEAAFGPGPYKL